MSLTIIPPALSHASFASLATPSQSLVTLSGVLAAWPTAMVSQVAGFPPSLPKSDTSLPISLYPLPEGLSATINTAGSSPANKQ